MAKTKTEEKSKNTPLSRLIALLLMGVICLSSAFSVAAFTLHVRIEDGDKAAVITTLKTETDEILEQAGITLLPDDEVIRNDDVNEYSAVITVKRAFNVTVEADGKSRTLVFTGGTVADALKAAKVVLDKNDSVTPRADAELEAGQKIVVTRYDSVTITADGVTRRLRVVHGNVADALEQAGITLGEEDILSLPEDTKLREGLKLNIDRVTYRDVVTEEEIPFETVIEDTRELYKGQQSEKTAGEAGKREIVTREKLLNGELVEAEEISNTVVKEPVTQVILNGTKRNPYPYTRSDVPGTFVDYNGQTVSYRAVMTGSCTAYTAPAGSGTATGRPAMVGNVAVNPKIIPYGTRMYITSVRGGYVYGYALAADTGGALMEELGLIDLFFDSLEDCYFFGRRDMVVYIL